MKMLSVAMIAWAACGCRLRSGAADSHSYACCE